jgi:hypothetical protein
MINFYFVFCSCRFCSRDDFAIVLSYPCSCLVLVLVFVFFFLLFFLFRLLFCVSKIWSYEIYYMYNEPFLSEKASGGWDMSQYIPIVYSSYTVCSTSLASHTKDAPWCAASYLSRDLEQKCDIQISASISVLRDITLPFQHLADGVWDTTLL